MNAAELCVKALEQEGVEYIFGIPGDENLHFMEAVRKSDKITFVLTRHEQAAGFMAAAHSRLTGKIACALSTLGAGASNLVTAVADANLSATPVVFLTGQKSVHDNTQGQYQLLDVVSMMRPITKYSHSVLSAQALPSVVHEAFRLAKEDRQGAVHLELPEDVMAQSGDYPLLPKNEADSSVAGVNALEKAKELLEKAKRPLVMVGGGTHTNREDVSEATRAFLDKTGIPFVVTMMGKGVAREDGEQYIGTTVMPGDYPSCAIDTCDVLLNIGHDVMEKPPFIMKTNDGRTVIHLNGFAARADNVYFPQHQVVGSMAHSLTYLREQITPSPSWDFADMKRAGEAMLKSIDNNSDNTETPIKPQHVTKIVRESLNDDDIVTVDNGIHMMWFTRNYPAYQRNTLLVDHALGSMGVGLPTAIAAKMVHTDKTVVSVVGDGGFMMNSQELETAVRLKLDLIVIIFNDNALGMIKLKQHAMKYGEIGVTFNNPDIVMYANSFGATGHRLDGVTPLADVLKVAKDTGGVHVIDVPIDSSQNMMLMKEIMMLDCQTVTGHGNIAHTVANKASLAVNMMTGKGGM
jgi:acetolactate synthase-1/2/3 large subunit